MDHLAALSTSMFEAGGREVGCGLKSAIRDRVFASELLDARRIHEAELIDSRPTTHQDSPPSIVELDTDAELSSNNRPREGSMLEAALVGGLTGLAALFFFRWREERTRALAWKTAFEFARQEVTRWKSEAERWVTFTACQGQGNQGLQETEIRLPNVEELFRKRG
jgi:hypothetical protein